MTREVGNIGDLALVLTGNIRRAAFRRLLLTRSATRADELAIDLGRSVEEVARGVDEHGARGRVRIDAAGRVTGAAGLSVVPDRHRIEIGGRTFWTWCAYDVVGIFGALRAWGAAHSPSPSSGADIVVGFEHGRPLPSPAALFRLLCWM